jgi:transcriptional regulator with GAF, ATPase, and Fis domain
VDRLLNNGCVTSNQEMPVFKLNTHYNSGQGKNSAMLNSSSNKSTRSAPERSDMQGLKQTLERVAAELIRVIDASGCYIYVKDENQGFIPLLAEGSAEAEQSLFFSNSLSPQTDTLLYRMLARPVTLAFSQELGARRMDGSILDKLQAQSAVAAPILVGKDLIGMLLVVQRERPEGFSDLATRQIEWLATSITPALENSRLYHQTLERLAETEALHQVTLAILQKSRLDDVLKIICGEAQQMTAACGASIALVENSSWIRVMYCVGETPDKLGRLRASCSHLGRAIHHRAEPLIINQSPERPDFIPRLAIPLLSNVNNG